MDDSLIKYYNLKFGNDHPPRFPFQNPTSCVRGEKSMSYILQNQMITKFMSSGPQFTLFSNPNI